MRNVHVSEPCQGKQTFPALVVLPGATVKLNPVPGLRRLLGSPKMCLLSQTELEKD